MKDLKPCWNLNSVCICLSVLLSVYVCLCVCLCLYVCKPVSVCVSMRVSLFVSVCVSEFLCLSVYLPVSGHMWCVYLSRCLCVCVYLCVNTTLREGRLSSQQRRIPLEFRQDRRRENEPEVSPLDRSRHRQ